jgi:hypothetical protein
MITETITLSTGLKVEAVDAIYHRSKHLNACTVCGKKMSDANLAKGLMVHALHTGPYFINNFTAEIPESAGCLPIGSECAKKFPKGFVHNFS